MRRLFVAVCLLAALAGGLALYRSPLLRVEEVEVVGAKNLTPQQITELAGLAAALLTFVPKQLSLGVSRFEYTPEHGLSLTTNANYRVVMGDGQNVDYKMAVWKAVEEDIGRGAMAGHVLDLRFRDHPSFQ